MQPQNTPKAQFKRDVQQPTAEAIKNHYLVFICAYSVVCIKPNWWAESELQGRDKLNENLSEVTSTCYFHEGLERKAARSLAGTGFGVFFLQNSMFLVAELPLGIAS